MAQSNHQTCKTIGILGAGQLGRMLALAGIPLGYNFEFTGSSLDEPAGATGKMHLDQNGAAKIAEVAEVISFESENTDVELVKQLTSKTKVYPGVDSLFFSQNRLREKTIFTELSIGCAEFAAVNSLQDLQTAVEKIGLPAILKTTTEGYDGKGQFVIKSTDQLNQAWLSIGEREAILEGFVDFKRELSLIAARNPNGEIVFYPLVENHHKDGILRLTIAPAAQISDQLQQQAENYMRALLERLNHVGVLALELFETSEGLVANEMAPRVHNSGHWSMEGAQTSQFENHIRAICNLPLGTTAPRQPFAAMVNIIGEHGDLNQVLQMPNTYLHLYNKTERTGRKLGHINLVANSQQELDTNLQKLKAWL